MKVFIRNIIRSSTFLYSVYNYLNFLKNTMLLSPQKDFTIPENCVPVAIDGYLNTFCGYYDVSPFSPTDNSLILVHANNAKPNTNPSSKYKTTVGIWNDTIKRFEKIDTTQSWNWQQGARLQWINEDTIAYNVYDFKMKSLHAKLVNIHTLKQEILPMSIHSSFGGRFILSINFQNLTNYTEYGYPGTVIRNDSMGIDIFDLSNYSRQEVLNIKELFAFFPNEKQHWDKVHINHPQFSPDGSLLIFTFRFQIKNQRFDNLFCIELNTKKISHLIENQIISHYSWIDDSCIIFWGIIDRKKGYYKFYLNRKFPELIFPEENDGHPVPFDSNFFISDTYPDIKSWKQKLQFYNALTGKRLDVLTLPHPIVPFSSSYRCDFHPSLSLDKKKFQIDTRVRNNRSIIIGEMSHLLLSLQN